MGSDARVAEAWKTREVMFFPNRQLFLTISMSSTGDGILSSGIREFEGTASTGGDSDFSHHSRFLGPQFLLTER